MNIVTETEYDLAVEEVSHEVFDPLGDDGGFSDEILDLIEDGQNDAAKERIVDRCIHKSLFSHPFHTGPLSGSTTEAETLSVVHGCIVEHGSRINSTIEQHADRPQSTTARNRLGEDALLVFASDVKRDVYRRVRKTVNSEE